MTMDKQGLMALERKVNKLERDLRKKQIKPYVKFDQGDHVCGLNHRLDTVFYEILEVDYACSFYDSETGEWAIEYRALTTSGTMRRIADENMSMDEESLRIRRVPSLLFNAEDALNLKSEFYKHKDKYKDWIY